MHEWRHGDYPTGYVVAKLLPEEDGVVSSIRSFHFRERMEVECGLLHATFTVSLGHYTGRF